MLTAWSALLLAAMVPAANAVTVLLTSGRAGYASGLRANIWVKPPRFSNGDAVPVDKARSALAICFFGMLAIALAPAAVLPVRFFAVSTRAGTEAAMSRRRRLELLALGVITLVGVVITGSFTMGFISGRLPAPIFLISLFVIIPTWVFVGLACLRLLSKK